MRGDDLRNMHDSPLRAHRKLRARNKLFGLCASKQHVRMRIRVHRVLPPQTNIHSKIIRKQIQAKLKYINIYSYNYQWSPHRNIKSPKRRLPFRCGGAYYFVVFCQNCGTFFLAAAKMQGILQF